MGKSSRGEHIFNNIGKTVLEICGELQKNLGFSDERKFPLETPTRYDFVLLDNSHVIKKLEEVCRSCQNRTGHGSSNTVDGIKSVGLCTDPKNAAKNTDRSFADLSKTIKDYARSLTFKNIRWYRNNVMTVNDYMLNRDEIVKRVVDKGAYYSAKSLSNKQLEFEEWVTTTKRLIVILLKNLHETIREIRKNVNCYYNSEPPCPKGTGH
jgi:hypothetical protein